MIRTRELHRYFLKCVLLDHDSLCLRYLVFQIQQLMHALCLCQFMKIIEKSLKHRCSAFSHPFGHSVRLHRAFAEEAEETVGCEHLQGKGCCVQPYSVLAMTKLDP